MTKQEIELRMIDNALKKEERITALKAKHGITGTLTQQKQKLETKRLQVNQNENEKLI